MGQWGWNGGKIRTEAWDNPTLQSRLQTRDTQYVTSVLTWQEQRAFITNAVAALGTSTPIYQRFATALAEVQPVPFDDNGFVDVNFTKPFSVGNHVKIAFSPQGAIASLIGPAGRDWAGEEGLCRVWYHGMSGAYFDAFGSQYNIKKATNFIKVS